LKVSSALSEVERINFHKYDLKIQVPGIWLNKLETIEVQYSKQIIKDTVNTIITILMVMEKFMCFMDYQTRSVKYGILY